MQIRDMPKAVFFDWDGTLVDTLPWLFQAHNHVRTTLGLSAWSLPEFKQITRYSSRELYAREYGEDAQRAHEILNEYIENHHLDNLRPYADSDALLVFLSSQHITVGIVSNKKDRYLKREIEHLGWQNYVSFSIGAGVTERDKPAADPLLKALSACAVRPHEKHVWYVGDSETDMLTAEASGCAAILIRHNHDNENLTQTYKPLFVFDDCHHIKHALHL